MSMNRRENKEWWIATLLFLVLFGCMFLVMLGIDQFSKYTAHQYIPPGLEMTRRYEVIDMWISDDMSVAVKTKDSTGRFIETTAVGPLNVFIHDEPTILIVIGYVEIGSVHDSVKEMYLYVNRYEYADYLKREGVPDWVSHL